MNDKELIEKGYRKYSGKDIDVYFNTNICIHSGVCVRGLSEVFNTKEKPWIQADKASADDVAMTIDACPSGALKYIRREK